MSNFFSFLPVEKISSHDNHKYFIGVERCNHHLEKLITDRGGYERPDDPAQKLEKVFHAHRQEISI